METKTVISHYCDHKEHTRLINEVNVSWKEHLYGCYNQTDSEIQICCFIMLSIHMGADGEVFSARSLRLNASFGNSNASCMIAPKKQRIHYPSPHPLSTSSQFP